MQLPRMRKRGLAGQGSGRLRSIAGRAISAAMIVLLLAVVGFLDFRRYQPPRGTATVDQLVASLPETLKFAEVEQGGRSYVVWIGRPRGVIVSGPPVYVFDTTGTLVDRVGDAGDSDNKFVRELYIAASHAPGITAQEAVTYCRRSRMAPRASSSGALR
jgi:hypothetical protein